MKVEVQKIDAIKREIRFEIPKEKVAQKLDQVYEDLGKVSAIKGFRPGKAPRHVLEAHHGKFAKEEMIKKLIPEVYEEGLQQEKIIPIDLPEISDIKFQDGILSFNVRLDIKPEIDIRDYKGIPVKRKSSQVSEEESNKAIEFLAKGQGKDEAVVMDDIFARGLGYPTFEEFKRSLHRQMETEKDRYNRVEVDNQVIDYLIKNSSFVVPESLVSHQLERRLKETQKYMRSRGMPEEEIKRRESELQQELQPLAERDTKVYLLLDKIAELEHLSIQKDERLSDKVMEFLLKEAKWE